MKFLFFILLTSISWDVHAATNTHSEVTSHTEAPASESLCETLFINMYDSYGDGWNGGTLSIISAWNNVVWSGTLSSGYSSSQSVCLWAGCYAIVVSGKLKITCLSFSLKLEKWYMPGG